MEWVDITLHTTSEHGLSSITTNNKTFYKLPSSMVSRELSIKFRQFQHYCRFRRVIIIIIIIIIIGVAQSCSDIFKLCSTYLLKIIQSLPPDPHILSVSSRLNCTLPPSGLLKMDSSVSPKDEIWFLRVCHHISKALYYKMCYTRLPNGETAVCQDCCKYTYLSKVYDTNGKVYLWFSVKQLVFFRKSDLYKKFQRKFQGFIKRIFEMQLLTDRHTDKGKDREVWVGDTYHHHNWLPFLL